MERPQKRWQPHLDLTAHVLGEAFSPLIQIVEPEPIARAQQSEPAAPSAASRRGLLADAAQQRVQVPCNALDVRHACNGAPQPGLIRFPFERLPHLRAKILPIIVPREKRRVIAGLMHHGQVEGYTRRAAIQRLHGRIAEAFEQGREQNQARALDLLKLLAV